MILSLIKSGKGFTMTVLTKSIFISVLIAASLSYAFYAQYHGYPPCHLCWYERYCSFSVLLFSLLSIRYQTTMTCVSIFLCVAFGVSIFHVGVEQHFWSSSCSVSLLSSRIMEHSEIRCDDVIWRFFGLSMATWNAILTFCLCIFSLLPEKRNISS